MRGARGGAVPRIFEVSTPAAGGDGGGWMVVVVFLFFGGRSAGCMCVEGRGFVAAAPPSVERMVEKMECLAVDVLGRASTRRTRGGCSGRELRSALSNTEGRAPLFLLARAPRTHA